jgi:ferrochelatase
VADAVGVVVMAYGTPASAADVERYYTDIRRGRAPSPEQLAELRARYDAIGGLSPLLEITQQQCAVLGRALGEGYEVRLGQKHAAPFIEDAVAELADAGVGRIVGLVLAPHFSAMSVGEYATRATAAAEQRGVTVTMVDSWHLMPTYLEFLAAAVTKGLAALPAGSEVVFTAHSLPERVVDTGDPYPDQVRATAESVATLAALRRWSTAWQSAGRTPEPWLGPDVLDLVRDRAESASPGILVCPCGFVADHLEVLYDLDVEAARVAAEVELPFARTESLNADPAVLAQLADTVRAVAAG